MTKTMRPVVSALLGLVLLACGGGGAGTFRGQSYEGPPVEGGPVMGCEGCGNPGDIRFGEDERVEVTWPGSDIIEVGTYEVDGDTVVLTLDGEAPVRLSVEQGGAVLVGPHGTRYTRQ